MIFRRHKKKIDNESVLNHLITGSTIRKKAFFYAFGPDVLLTICSDISYFGYFLVSSSENYLPVINVK